MLTPTGSSGSGGSGTAGGLGGSTTTGGVNTGGTTPVVPVATADAATCAAYCTAITATCTGANAQYPDQATCLKACSFMPAGTPADMNVNSVGCRAHLIDLAKADTMAVKGECFQGGPLGFGTCGQECEALCGTALGYCSATSGYTGAAPYPSADDCSNICSQFTRPGNIDFSSPGNYNITGVTGDTLECRAYQLIVKGLASAAGQAMACADVANMSPTCGMGVVVLQPDPGGTGGSGGAPPVVVTHPGMNPINSTNWDETKYPFATRRMILRDEGNPHLHLIDLGHPKDPMYNWSVPTDGAWARAAQLIGHNQILGGRNDGYEVYDLTDGHIIKQVKTFPNTQSAYRLANGETMLTQSGTKLTFLGPDDKVTHSISYPGYGYVRLARPTRNGTFLVPSDTKVFEGDVTGKVLWSTTSAGWSHIWEPLLLGPPVGGGMWNDGDTLICTAFGSSCEVIDKVTHKVGFKFGTKQMPMADMYKPNFFSEYEILPNGNIICSNWQGHGGGNGNSGIQVIEFDPKGNVVWTYHQAPDPAFLPDDFSSIQGVMVLDGKDPQYLHVQETSTDSTWQPVIPTP